MELKQPKAILFDWDNTLVNTWPVIHEALHKTFEQMGLEPWSMELVKQRVSRSMRDSFPQIFGPDWQEAGELYQSQFRAIHLERLEALADAQLMLDYIKELPIFRGVVSNKKGVNLRKEVGHIGWGHYFDIIVGADDAPRDKPFPDPILLALKDSNIAAGGDVWFVGDSVVDMEASHSTGCVSVWYGEEPPEPLAFGYDKIVHNHQEFKALLEQMF